MIPIQEVEIRTKNGRAFFVHLERWSEAHFECKLAAINLGPQLAANATFGPFSKGTTPLAAYTSLITGLRAALTKLDATDAIAVVHNPCNAEFVNARDQTQALGQGVVVQVNGVDA